MQIPPVPLGRRIFPLRFLAGALLLAAASCSAGEPAVPAGPSPDVLESRAVLGDPMLQLAESVIDVADGIDEARHDARRGEEMLRSLESVDELLEAVPPTVADARRAADEAPVETAAEVVRDAAVRAEEAIAAAEEELFFLKRLNRVDVVLFDAVEQWDEPGSQSEIRARLDALATEVAGLRPRVRRLAPVPVDCTVMIENRLDWVRVVRQRTNNLQAKAAGGTGDVYDQLRGAYRRLPVGVEPRAADRADRQCWESESTVAQAADDLRDAVDRLRESLSG